MTAADVAALPRQSYWRRARWLRRLGIAVLLVAGLYLARLWWLPAAGRWLDVGEPPVVTDYCLVLSGAYETRPFAAAALYRRGYVRRQIWLTHVADDNGSPLPGMSANAAVTKLLVSLGVPRSQIAVLEGTCNTTFDEAQALARRLDAEPQATVTVVTSNYHTRRSRWVFRHVLGQRAEQLRFFSVPTDNFTAECWWQVEEGFSTYPKEYLKLVFYWFRYGWAAYWLAAGIAALIGFRIWRRRAAKQAPSGERSTPRALPPAQSA